MPGAGGAQSCPNCFPLRPAMPAGPALSSAISQRQSPCCGCRKGWRSWKADGSVAGLGALGSNLIHVEARDAKAALSAIEEGLRCAGLGGVIGELWGDPPSARLHRDAAVGGGGGAVRGRLLADPDAGRGQPVGAPANAGGWRAHPAWLTHSTTRRRAPRAGLPTCSARACGIPAVGWSEIRAGGSARCGCRTCRSSGGRLATPRLRKRWPGRWSSPSRAVTAS